MRLDPTRLGTHSLRSGGARALFDASVDTIAIKLFGRAPSDCVERHTRVSAATLQTMAMRMMGDDQVSGRLATSTTTQDEHQSAIQQHRDRLS